jgi:hypothetical protein
MTIGRNRLKYTLVTTAAVLGLGGCLWSAAFAALWVGGDEGAMPPMSRMPDLPAGASVVAQDRECGSGGCNWKITVRPAPGQSPEDLARSMGLTRGLSLPPTLFDPGSVSLGSEPDDGQLIVRFGYSGGFK